LFIFPPPQRPREPRGAPNSPRSSDLLRRIHGLKAGSPGFSTVAGQTRSAQRAYSRMYRLKSHRRKGRGS
jgi:hypothetical protein